MNNYQKMIESETVRAKEKIAALRHGVSVMRGLPEMDGIDHMHASDVDGGRVFVTAAYDLPTYRANRKLLFGAGWRVMKAFIVSSKGSRYAELKRGDECLSYVMETEAPGSTCTRTKVAEVAQAVYEVVCK